MTAVMRLSGPWSRLDMKQPQLKTRDARIEAQVKIYKHRQHQRMQTEHVRRVFSVSAGQSSPCCVPSQEDNQRGGNENGKANSQHGVARVEASKTIWHKSVTVHKAVER